MLKTPAVLALTEVRLTFKLRRSQIILLVVNLLCVSLYVLVELQYVLRAAESASNGIMAPTYIESLANTLSHADRKYTSD